MFFFCLSDCVYVVFAASSSVSHSRDAVVSVQKKRSSYLLEWYVRTIKLKLNLGVLVHVYPTGLLFTWNDLIRATVEQKLIF